MSPTQVAAALRVSRVVAVLPSVSWRWPASSARSAGRRRGSASAATLPLALPRTASTRYVQERMAAWSVPGLSLAIVEDGQVSVTRGYGLADREQARPMTPQTLVAVGSTTKPVTAPAVLQLVEQGNVDLDAPVTRYLPWFTLDDPRVGRDHRAASF